MTNHLIFPTIGRSGGRAARLAMAYRVVLAAGIALMLSSRSVSPSLAAGANPSLTVNPTTATRGQTVTIHAAGLTPNANAFVIVVDGGSYYMLTQSPQAVSPDGTLTQTGTVPPDAKPGATILQLEDGNLADIPTVPVFQILAPTITVNPTTVTRAQGGIEFSASGLVANEPVSVVLQDASGHAAQLAQANADASGNVSLSNLNIPLDTAVGSGSAQLLAARDNLSVPVTVASPTLNVNPVSGVPEQQSIAVTGSGFVANDQVGLSLVDASGNNRFLAHAVVDGTGKLSMSSWFVPVDAVRGVGSLQLQAQHAQDNLSIPFRVLGPTLSVDSPSATQHQTVSVLGSGFVAHEDVAVVLQDSVGTISQLGQATTDQGGSVAVGKLTIPATAASGAASLQLQGTYQDSASVPFTVLTPTLNVNVPTVVREQGGVGVSGSGFAPNEQVALSLQSASGVSTALQTVFADASGNLSVPNLPVPMVAPGLYVVTGLDQLQNHPQDQLTILSPTVSVMPTSVAPGQASINVGGSGLVANEDFGVVLRDASGTSSMLAHGAADSIGNVSLTTVIPNGTPAGPATLELDGALEQKGVSTPISITGAAGSAVPTDKTYAQAVLNESPAGFWRLNETSTGTISDASSHGLIGQTNGAVMPSEAGPTSGATGMAFDGQSGYITLNDLSALQPSTLSVEAWVNTTSTQDTHNWIVRKGPYGYGLYLDNTGAPAVAIGQRSGASSVSGAVNVSDGKWHYLVGTYDGSQVCIYVDDNMAPCKPAGAIVYRPNMVVIGRDGSASDGYFNGVIADVAIYPQALSVQQVAAHYAAAQVVKSPVPVASQVVAVAGCPVANLSSTTNCPLAGQMKLTIYGSGFSQGTPTANICDQVVVASDTQIDCNLVPGTPDQIVDVQVTVAGSTSSGTSVTLRYAGTPPVVLAVGGCPVANLSSTTNCPLAGQMKLTIHGSGFSQGTPTANICDQIVVASDTQIDCNLVPGTAGATLPVLVTTDGGTNTPTNNATLSYAS